MRRRQIGGTRAGHEGDHGEQSRSARRHRIGWQSGERGAKKDMVVFAAVVPFQSASAKWPFTRPRLPPAIRPAVSRLLHLELDLPSQAHLFPQMPPRSPLVLVHATHHAPIMPSRRQTPDANLPYCLCPKLVFGVFCEFDLERDVDRCRRRAGLQRCRCFRIGELD